MDYRVSEIAKIAKVSVRTIHYYDEIGLLKSRRDKTNNYRIYNSEDLKKLFEIRFYVEIGFSLKDIKSIFDDEGYCALEALEKHKKMLELEIQRSLRMKNMLEETIEQYRKGSIMIDNKKFEAFSYEEIEAQKDKYRKEVELKYGNTKEYSDYSARTKNYSKEKWVEVSKEMNNRLSNFSELINLELLDNRVKEAVLDFQQFITDNFYNCTDEILLGLADLYINDQRFLDQIDSKKEGTAKFLSDAIKANIKLG